MKSVYRVGLNLRSYVEQSTTRWTSRPTSPTHPFTSVIGQERAIRHDSRLTAALDYEIELAIMIGKAGTWIPREREAEQLFGYTVVNNVSTRELQWRTSQRPYRKSRGPVGPAITTTDALDDVVLRLPVDDDVQQQEPTGNIIFDPETIAADLSRGILNLDTWRLRLPNDQPRSRCSTRPPPCPKPRTPLNGRTLLPSRSRPESPCLHLLENKGNRL